MTSKIDTLETLPAEARDAARKARRILVVTGDGDDAYARTRAVAIQIAAETGAEVILYDHSAESHFVDPYLAGPVAAEVKGSHGESLLDEKAVETLGRAYLADQMREAKSQGVVARAWLPLQTGRQGVSEGVSRFDADLVIGPEAVAKDLEVGVPVLAFDETGKLAKASAKG
jgi:hypothetical protein